MSETQDTAYFLHQTPYRDNSAIVHFITKKNGKVSFIVSGLKAKKNAKRPFLQPCQRLQLDYQLKAGLSKLTHIDFEHGTQQTSPDISQFMFYQYANELLMTILPDHLPVPSLFDNYNQFLSLLAEKRPHAGLRHIEMTLVILFIGLPCVTHTEDTNEVIVQQKNYYFHPDKGLFLWKQKGTLGIQLDGAQALAFRHLADAYLNAKMDDISEILAQGAKPISSSLINHLLDGKRLKTRSVFQALQVYV